jgi:hypothetical protein
VRQERQEYVSSDLILDWEESEKQSLLDRELLEQSLKAYNKYVMYKLAKNGITEDYKITDENQLVLTDENLEYDTIIETDSIEYDTEILDGSMICRKGSTFLPIYVLTEKEERILPIDEKEIKVTIGKRTTTVVQTWKAKPKEKVKKLSITAHWLKDNSKKKAI